MHLIWPFYFQQRLSVKVYLQGLPGYRGLLARNPMTVEVITLDHGRIVCETLKSETSLFFPITLIQYTANIWWNENYIKNLSATWYWSEITVRSLIDALYISDQCFWGNVWSVILSWCFIKVSVMDPENGDSMGIPLIGWYICPSDWK